MLCVYVAARVLSQQNGRQWAKLWLHVHCSHSRRSVSIGFVPAELRREAKQALGALQRPKVLPPFGSYLGRYVYHHNPSIIWFYRPRPTERDSNSRVNSSSLLHPSRLGTFRAGGVGTSAVGGEGGRQTGNGGGGGGRRGHSLDSEVGGISPQDVETALAGNQIDGKRVLTVQIGDFMSDRDSVRGSGKTSARGSGKTSVGGSSKSGGVTPKPQDILSPRLRIKLPTTDGHGNITAPASITESPPLASSSRRSTHWGPPGPRKSNLSASPPMSNIWSSQTEIQQENHESISSAEVEMREAGWESGRRPSASVLAMDELEALAREVDAELSHNTPGLFRTPRASASEREIEGLERGSQEHALGVGGWSWAELAGGLSGGRASGSFSSRGGSHADTPPTSRQSSDPRM
mmetsp:Transcript_39211/g.90854  ORF Transcript_39211/g.90854 Transcript_39211/m.90854 type:complete len:406 (-) Transcript_39211:34-1251(-)